MPWSVAESYSILKGKIYQIQGSHIVEVFKTFKKTRQRLQRTEVKAQETHLLASLLKQARC